MVSSSPQRRQDAAKPASAAKPPRKAAAKDPERQRSSAKPVRRPSAAKPARPATVTHASSDHGGITLEDVGEIMNLTRERIRQVEVRGLLKLKMGWPSPDELGADLLAGKDPGAADQALIAVVGEVLSSQAQWASLRPHIEGLLRAAQLAPIVEGALVGDVASRAVGLDRLGDDLVARARIAGEAKRSLVTDDKLLTGAAVSKLLGSRSENPRQYASRLRQAGALLAIPSTNQYVYPAFQFDVLRKVVYPEIAMVGRLLDAANDPWGVLSWWQSPNARIGDRRPRDLLGTAEAKHLRSLAEAVVELVG
jgi:hypothetical protein